MPDENLEATYHFALSTMADMVDLFGYSVVLNDLDAMIADKLDSKVEALLNTDGVPVAYEEQN